MHGDDLAHLIVAERMAEAERAGERARLLKGVGRSGGLRRRLARLLVAVGRWLRPEPAGRPPRRAEPDGYPLSVLNIWR